MMMATLVLMMVVHPHARSSLDGDALVRGRSVSATLNVAMAFFTELFQIPTKNSLVPSPHLHRPHPLPLPPACHVMMATKPTTMDAMNFAKYKPTLHALLDLSPRSVFPLVVEMASSSLVSTVTTATQKATMDVPVQKMRMLHCIANMNQHIRVL